MVLIVSYYIRRPLKLFVVHYGFFYGYRFFCYFNSRPLKHSSPFFGYEFNTKCFLSPTDLIPTYILARGGKALAAYRRALKSGKTYDKRVKVMLIGEDRVGKTSLGKALKGESFKEDEVSTDGVLMSEAIKNASEKPWRNSEVHRKSSAYKVKCAEIIRQELLRGSTDQSSQDETPREATIELTAINQTTEQPGLLVVLPYLS